MAERRAAARGGWAFVAESYLLKLVFFGTTGVESFLITGTVSILCAKEDREHKMNNITKRVLISGEISLVETGLPGNCLLNIPAIIQQPIFNNDR